MWADQSQGLNNPLDNEVTWFVSGSLPTLLRNSTIDNIYSQTRLSVATIDVCYNSGRLHVQTCFMIEESRFDHSSRWCFSLLQNDQTRSAIHPSLLVNSAGTRDSFPGGKGSRT